MSPRRRLVDRVVRSATDGGPTMAVFALFVVSRLHKTGGPGGFPVAGAGFVHPDAPAELHRYASSYDGQFVYRFALDPFSRVVTAHGITLDLPAYRQQRIATSLLAYLVARLPGIGTALALVIVNIAAVLVAAVAAGALMRIAGRSRWWTPVLAVPAAIPISVGRDLTEPLAWAAILVALWAYRRHRPVTLALALVVAVLARETSLVVVGGLGLAALIASARGRRREVLAVLACSLALAVEVAWQAHLAQVWHTKWPMFSGASANGGAPLLGILEHFAPGLDHGGVTQRALALSYLAERIVLIGLIISSAFAVICRRTAAVVGERVSWLAAVLLALSLRNWGPDVAFLRATYEAWGLSVVVLVFSRTKWADCTLGIAAVVTGGVALLYAVRV